MMDMTSEREYHDQEYVEPHHHHEEQSAVINRYQEEKEDLHTNVTTRTKSRLRLSSRLQDPPPNISLDRHHQDMEEISCKVQKMNIVPPTDTTPTTMQSETDSETISNVESNPLHHFNTTTTSSSMVVNKEARAHLQEGNEQYQDMMYYHDAPGAIVDDSPSITSITATITSKPKEITCAMDSYNGNDSFISMPFSMDGMERAKRKILFQAAKIRDLEAQLKRNSINPSDDMLCDGNNNNTITKETGIESKKMKRGTSQSFKNVLSPEERLEAHKERKRSENKYKERSGKWGKPPPIRRQSLTSKVKKKEELVDRLVADPKERKRHDELKRSVAKTVKKYANCQDEDPATISEKRGKSKKKKQTKDKKSKNRDALMERLNMGVQDRRSFKHDDVPRNLKRTLNGHSLGKKSWVMAEQYGDKRSDEDSSTQQESQHKQHINSEACSDNIRCHACQSQNNCEEDIDNPGNFYCAQCWDEYEHEVISTVPYDQGSESTSISSRNIIQRTVADQEAGYEIDSAIQSKAAHDNDKALWVVHDDPKLGVRLVCSGPKRMSCLIETKEKDSVRIMIGSINYCGPVVRSGWRNAPVEETRRGAECIRMGNVFGYVINHNEVETRLARGKSVYEFRLDPTTGIPLTGKDAKMSLKDFLQDYIGAVDVILNPQCSPGGWYPQREANSSSSKIAPQFRSKGVGYIRLGDDMGANGLAFLSSDSCNTFFSTKSVDLDEGDGKVNRTMSSFGSMLRPNAKKPYSLVGDQTNHSKGLNYTNEYLGVDDEVSSYMSESSTAETSSHGTKESVVELIKQMESLEGSKEMKWNDKADLLIRLGKAVGKSCDQSSCSAALKTVQDVISSKNINVHVLRSALLAAGKIGSAMKKELCNDVSWKTIMIEMLKLLKNKQVSSTAKETLQHLHGTCYTLGNSLTSISHTLGTGKSGQLRTSKSFQKNKRRTLGTPLGKVASSGSVSDLQKTNNVEVIQWLAETTEIERSMEDVDPLIDKSGLSMIADCFLSHESHRDARCRKNSLDGLLHTMIYGMDHLGLTIKEAQSLCLDLKSSNSRSWSRLMKTIYSVLEEEEINVTSD